jgi:predicted nucleic acid-binding protein
MPMIELDMLIAFVSEADSLHSNAKIIFQKIRDGDLRDVCIPSGALLEYELLLKSRGVKDSDITDDILAYSTFPHLSEESLDSRKLIIAQRLREQYQLTYFDSLHAATALMSDRIIIGADTAYDSIPDIQRIDPRTYKASKRK